MVRVMRIRRPLVIVGCAILGGLPFMPSAAGASCGYSLQLTQGVVDGSPPRIPVGYDTAQQPSSSQLPTSLTAFGGGISAVDKTNCRTSRVTIRFQSRDASQPSFLTRRTLTTDVQGTFGVDARPTRIASVRAVATAPDGTPLTSTVTVVRVRTYVSATYTRAVSCALVAAGSTFPAKPNHPVIIETRVDGIYRRVATGRTDSRGIYRIRWNAGCGKHDLAVSVPASSSNDAGRTVLVRLGVLAR